MSFEAAASFQGGIRQPVVCLSEGIIETIKPLGRRLGICFDTSLGWGWLPGERLGAEEDVWSIYFDRLMMYPFNRSFWLEDYDNKDRGGPFLTEGWGEVVLPKTWNGDLKGLMLTGQTEPYSSFLVGEVTPGSPAEGYWISERHPAEIPAWPKLERGWYYNESLDGLELLGVLRQERGVGRSLLVAWGNREGKFLGWESVSDMEKVHQFAERKIIIPGPLDDWERFEQSLRAASVGREL